MADVLQAARWMDEGHIVRRNSEDADSSVRYKYEGDWLVAEADDAEFEPGMITLSDILATDWEIADDGMSQIKDEIQALKKQLKDRNDAYKTLAKHHNLHCTCLDIY